MPVDAPHKFVATLVALLPSVVGAKATYDDQVLPIFEQACLNCHNPDKTKGGLDLSSYSATLKGSSGGKIVEPGDLASTLLAVIKQNAEPKMPPEGDPLSSAQIEAIENWIAQGLLENPSSTARKASKPKFDASIQSNPGAKPDGPPPMPEHVLLEPIIVAPRASAIHAMVASPWAPLIAVTSQRQVLLYHTETLELLGVLPFPEGDPISLAFTPNARYLIVGGGTPGKSGRTVTFDVMNGERVLSAGKEFDTVIAADLHPNLDKVATGSPSRLIKLWKTEDGSQIASIKKHTDWVTVLDYSPDGILLATGDRNGGIWVWESHSGNEFHTLRAHQASITAIAFRPDSNLLASASEDGSVRFWEMNQGKEIKKIDAHPGGVLAFSWARDGSFATAGRNRTARLWKPDFAQLREIKDLDDIPTAIALNAEGNRLFIGNYHGLIAVHDVKTGHELGHIDANPPSIKTRLTRIEERIANHPSAISKAIEEHNQAASKVADLKKNITRLSGTAEHAKKSAASAKRTITDLEKKPSDDPSLKARAHADLEKARKASSDLDQKLAKSREALKVAERVLSETKTAVEEVENAVPRLKEERNHWLAADLNARAMSAAAQAAQLELESAKLTTEFSEHAQRVEASRTRLNLKRSERNAVQERLESIDEDAHEELASVLSTLEAVISKESSDLKKQETDFLQIRHEAELQLQKASAAGIEARRLKAAYFARLEPSP